VDKLWTSGQVLDKWRLKVTNAGQMKKHLSCRKLFKCLLLCEFWTNGLFFSLKKKKIYKRERGKKSYKQ